MKKITFEQYLQEIHMKQYKGVDDDAPDDFDNWESNLTAVVLEYYRVEYQKL